ncbi:MAG: iron-containing alcohol dehydrogenase [Deltaproteobacteria bacterium]|nr:iron-containing alcohol dehydrogenase [Deltaproteobacteria bacterium]
MSYWFQDPGIKALLPLATANSIKGLSTSFNTPAFIMGFNVFPEGMTIGPSTADIIGARCPRKRAFIVADEFSNQFAKKTAEYFSANGFSIEIWPQALPEVPVDNVKECAVAMTAFEPDVVMAVGGGSVMDSAKAAWILYEHPEFDDLGALVNPLILLGLRKKAFLVAVPTTSGTGSECTPVSVLHDTSTHRKVPIANGELLPDMAILVPEFTISMPPKLTAGTGLDVLAHALDGIMTPAANEFTDAMGLTAIKMTFKYLPRAYKNGKDREARYRMIIAASAAGISFGQNAAALTHSLGHSIGSLFNIHHGLSVGMLIPYCLQYYRPVSDKYLDICHALRIEGSTPDESFDNLIKAFRDLFKTLDVPLSLEELGIKTDEFDSKMETLVLYTMEDIDTFFSPRPITADQCEQLLRYAYDGRDIDF